MKLLAVLGLGVNCGIEIEVVVSGDNEAADADSVKTFLEEIL